MSTSRLSGLVTLTFAILLLLQLVQAQSDVYQYEQKRQGASKYCGQQLSNALQLVCHGRYNPMFKKSVGQGMEMDDYPFNYDDSYPFRSRAVANAMMGRFGAGRFRRDSRGVHDECCLKSCTMNEMRSYCAIPQ
ncbi:LIRP [Nasonia vitripennis]|uniref:Insulin-like domain-containing protein n=1 Tax=Nasonia vitripennis TaxID=7425 RepID=A0A7M7LJ26_NASVI|nr:LIRP [Nasonia vitripennis]XP_016839749.1 LIRP [Nasonia vitripennis]